MVCMSVYVRALPHRKRQHCDLPAPFLVSVTPDTALSVMSQYLIDVTQVELMESSCDPCLWDINLNHFISLARASFICSVCLVSLLSGPSALKSLQVGRNRPLFVCWASDSCCGSVHLSLQWPHHNVRDGMSEAPLCRHPCPTQKHTDSYACVQTHMHSSLTGCCVVRWIYQV